MAWLTWCSGFEFGLDVAASWIKGNAGYKPWDTHGVNVATGTAVSGVAAPHSGTYALKVDRTAGATDIQLSTDTLGTSKTACAVSLWFRYPSSIPTGGAASQILAINSVSSTATLSVSAAGALQCQNTTGNTVTWGGTLVADTWYQVDLCLDCHANPHTIQWAVSGSGQTAPASYGVAASTISTVQIAYGGGNTGELWIDDVVVSSTLADYPLGPHKVVLLVPSGTATEFGTANTTSTFTANGTVGTTFNSASLISYTSEVPPLIGASASGLAIRANNTNSWAIIPMSTYTLGAGESFSGLRTLICGWAASATGNKIYINSGLGNSILDCIDPNFDANATTPGWICATENVSSTTLNQTNIDGLAPAIGNGTSVDINPVPGAHAVYIELAVKISTSLDASPTVASVAGPAPSIPIPTYSSEYFQPRTALAAVQRAATW